MKKKEILDLFRAKEIISDKDNLLCTEKCSVVLNEVKQLPNLRELGEDFEILRQEINERLKELKEATNSYNNLIKKCHHEVRLCQRTDFGISYECLFCRKTISREGYESWEE